MNLRTRISFANLQPPLYRDNYRNHMHGASNHPLRPVGGEGRGEVGGVVGRLDRFW